MGNRSLVVSTTRLGYFWKNSTKNFLTRKAQIFGNFLGQFENWHFLSKNYVTTIWATFGKTSRLCILIPIWSHWSSSFLEPISMTGRSILSWCTFAKCQPIILDNSYRSTPIYNLQLLSRKISQICSQKDSTVVM